MITKRLGVLGGAFALTLTGAGVAADNPSTTDEDLRARLLAAEARIAELETQGDENWLTEQRTDEIRNLVHDVLADADTRASLLQSGMTAGYDNGFVISTDDGNWLLRINGLLQTRFVFNRTKNPGTGTTPAQDGDEYRWGFENARTKLIFSGNIVDPSWTYRVEMNFNRGESQLDGSRNGADGFAFLDDAWIRWDYGNGFGVKMGQFVAPVLRESLVWDAYAQTVDRSNVDAFFTGGRTQGIAVEYVADQWRAWGSFNDGARTLNTVWQAYDTEWSFTARAEFMTSGTWDQFEDITSAPGDEFGALIGGAIHIQKDEYGTPSNTEARNMILTVDGQVEFGGANVFGYFVWSESDPDVGEKTDNWGFVVQGGFYVTDEWEPFVRYEYIKYDSDFGGVGTNLDDLSMITIGINRYFAGQNVKWTTDFIWGLNAIQTSTGSVYGDGSLAGLNGVRDDSSNDDDGQWAIRTQLQLLF